MIKTGDIVKVRLALLSSGGPFRPWAKAYVDLASGNGHSLAVSAPEGLATPQQGFSFNAVTGRQVLLLTKGEKWYQDVPTGTWWEVEEESQRPAQGLES